MKTIRLELSEFVDDANGGHFEERIEDLVFRDDQVRHEDLCTVCGWPDYPGCIAECPNMKLLEKQRSKEAKNRE